MRAAKTSGKETMRKAKIIFLIWIKLLVMGMFCLGSLCGCTKREELILLTQESQGLTEDRDITGEMTEGEESSDLNYIEEESRTIYVHVCGAVMDPGVYELASGSRVYEAVQAAGGFSENAEESYVNQAQELPDGVKLVIPTVEEADRAGQTALEAGGESGTETGVQIGIVAQEDALTAGMSVRTETAQTRTDDGRININTASAEELCTIPGIGAVRAAAVLAYREKYGSFTCPEDIMKVDGIKEGTYEKIKDSISVK